MLVCYKRKNLYSLLHNAVRKSSISNLLIVHIVKNELYITLKLNFIVIYIVYCKNLLWFRGRHSYHILYVEWYYLEGSLEYGKKYYNI